jgi:hypothetical protein
MELSIKETVIVSRWCMHCEYWDDYDGCNHPTAIDPRPVADCSEYKEKGG